jgi:hypothetical protein
MQDRGYVQDLSGQPNRQPRKMNSREPVGMSSRSSGFRRAESLQNPDEQELIPTGRLSLFSNELDLPNWWPRMQVPRNAGVTGYCHLPQSVGTPNFG